MMKDIVKKNIQNYQNLLRSIEDFQREDIPVTDDLIGDCIHSITGSRYYSVGTIIECENGDILTISDYCINLYNYMLLLNFL